MEGGVYHDIAYSIIGSIVTSNQTKKNNLLRTNQRQDLTLHIPIISKLVIKIKSFLKILSNYPKARNKVTRKQCIERQGIDNIPRVKNQIENIYCIVSLSIPCRKDKGT